MSSPHISCAEDAIQGTPEIPKPLKVMPVKIHPVQSSADELSKAAPDKSDTAQPADTAHLEMLTPREGYGFPPDFWKNSSRKDIVDFLSAPVTTIPNPTIRDMTLRATLTPAPNLSSGNADENLYALRLQRLVAMGDFQDGLLLYKLNETSPPTPLAARAGVEAILGHGDMAIACLEQKALDATLKTDTPQTWANIDTLCQALLSPVAGSDDSLRLSNAARIYADARKLPQSITATDLNATDIVSAIAMIKTDRVSGILTNSDALSALNDRTLALFLSYINDESPAKPPVLAEAVKRGLITAEESIPESLTEQTSTPSSAPLESSGNSEELDEKARLSQLLSTTPETDKVKYPVLLALKMAFDPTNVNKSVYDNILNLTESDNYVMPNAEILSSLKKSADQKQMAQAVILSLKVLTDTPMEQLHPAALYRIFEALNSAGLSEETLSLARNVLKTLLEKK